MSLIFNYLPNWREKRPYVLFQELEQFVCSLDRYDDRFVEETFAEYAIERLEGVHCRCDETHGYVLTYSLESAVYLMSSQ